MTENDTTDRDAAVEQFSKDTRTLTLDELQAFNTSNKMNIDRTIIPQITIEDIGTGKLGWYMAVLNIDWDKEKRYPIFQSQCCNIRSVMTEHSIDSDGTVNASILCYCNKYHVFGIFENWPADLQKKAHSLTVTSV